MWPWGHLAVAYLLYTGYTARRFDRSPRFVPLVALAIGSQFPDLIDKPFAWTFGVLPGGRTLSHSLLFVALFLPAIYVAADRLEFRSASVAFSIGYLSHLLADIPPSVLTGEPTGAAYLLWPVVEQPPEDPIGGILDAFLNYYTMGPYEWLQLGLFVGAVLVWYRDGAPGLATVRASVRRYLPTRS
ncbi:metal-dependent hydrolase [Natrialba taiwanensis]|uniref:Membrane-bound metal-dependent hydrolase n=1 Tax=Natrialba taiwanensis DSM 12281 TaxID=1230458 RepID=L9ZR67_9EURY|nr:metal-dependent hydrolase [Natrialba taiwanensis]ELY88859.1 membrane-bound metal-dependent hydrolase [Natrialba taiwanensis DSM 12281]